MLTIDVIHPLLAATGAAPAAPAGTGGSNPGDVFMSILPYAVIIIFITVVGGIVMMISRRKIDAAGSGGPVGFTLADLKELRDRGELSEAEYDRARQDVIERARRAFRTGDRGEGAGRGPSVR